MSSFVLLCPEHNTVMKQLQYRDSPNEEKVYPSKLRYKYSSLFKFVVWLKYFSVLFINTFLHTRVLWMDGAPKTTIHQQKVF